MKNNKLKEVFKNIYNILDVKQKIKFAVIVLIMIVSAGLSQVTPKALKYLVDKILSDNSIELQVIEVFLLIILVANVVNEVIKIVRRVMVEDVATSTEKKARGMVIKSLLKAPLSYFKDNMTGNIHGRLNRCLDGTVKLEKLIFMDFAPAVFNSIAAVVVLVTEDVPLYLSIPSLLVIPIGIYLVMKQIKSQRGIRVDLLESKSSMDGTIVELINGIEVIRICDSVDFEVNRFDGKSEFLRNKEMKHHKEMAKYDMLKFLNQVLFTVAVIGGLTYLAAKGEVKVGCISSVTMIYIGLLKPLEELHRIFDEVSECTVLAQDFFKMVEIKNDFSYDTIENKTEVEKTEEIINVKNVNFYYNEKKDSLILDNFNIDVNKGMYLGIAGPSGCGKSSFIKSICKLEKAEGTIILDDNDINSLTRAEIADLIALVPQAPFLIAGTILENITYGMKREVSIEEVREAARRAYILDYIEGLPDGFNSMISEGGGNLSGGQRQRMAIARIFLRKPKILILDEATSALDNTSEKFIQTEIEKLQKENNTTVIAIAHRLTTLKNCDRIIVLNKGKIQEDGKYDELIEQNGMFSDMYYGRLK